ncbi:MAG TPA: class II aldolase/adducin family protein [Blastocatellia bacterium]|nr:class II aldolase/adducin family protein [Blastocatellia bacterium]
MRNERDIRKKIVEIGREVYARGFIAASDGNISARLDDGTIVTTPTMVCKGRMSEDMLVLVDIDGRKLRREERNPSSEFSMHRTIYRLRPDVHAVVHAHPPFGTGFAVANVPLDKPLLSEVILTLGCIPLTAYGTPSTTEIPDSLSPYIPHHDALLLANHGAVAYGPDLQVAYDRMETLEHFAKIALIARLVGKPKELPAQAIEKLLDVREQSGYMPPEARTCQSCGYLQGHSSGCATGPVPRARADANGDETVTLTRKELTALITEAARLVEREKNR